MMTKNKTNHAMMMANAKFYSSYARWNDATAQYESWDASVDRVMSMHNVKFADHMSPELSKLMGFASSAYKQKLVLGSQRALQFGGEQLLRHQAKMYNCSSSYADRAAFFQEAMYLLLCGCGVGFSVQNRHVSKLPALLPRFEKRVKVYQVADSIEGWSDAFGVLLSSFFEDGGTFPEFKGCQVHFDFSQIRPAGALISGGFKAPGPEPLRKALLACEALLNREVALGQVEGVKTAVKMRPIVAYDYVMHMADAVLAGGVRRSATICLFDKSDKEMLGAKMGDWYPSNPQRGRSNNSVVLKRDELTRAEWADIMNYVRSYGEPGFVFVDNLDAAFNPCVEIGMLPIAEDGETGFQFCNLVEINGGQCVTVEDFYRACRAGAILGTIQAGYTDFKYVSDATRRITEREALIGVSITGWMNNPQVLFDEAVMKKGAEIVKQTNREVAALLGINPAARTTCVKPSGNASVLLGTASGIHGEHSPMYFRNVQLNVSDEVAKLIAETNPHMVEKSVWNANGTDLVVSFPVVSPETSIYKKDLLGVKQLEFVKKAQQHWIENGTNLELCVDKTIRHNVSNTITVDDWDEVEQYIFDNRQWFAGISLLAAAGDKAYAQAPFTEVFTAKQLEERYGEASMFASGLIVDGNHAFNNNLWLATDTAMAHAMVLPNGARIAPDVTDEFTAQLNKSMDDLLQRDWVRRFHKFAVNFFDSNLETTAGCLKDVYNLHKWTVLQRNIESIDFETKLSKKDYVDVNSLGAQACAGGACEVSFN